MSNLSAFPYITERAPAVPALWNDVYSILSANIKAVDSGVSTVGLGNFQQLSVGSTPPSYLTTAAITVAVNSAFSDYLYLTDSSGARSNYVIGSRAGGTADGLNIWDASGATMIASFSKQSVRFFQQVVGPVFDVGGALANTLNAATFGTGADSLESRIQAAISAATTSNISRVYIPSNMYPYSAASLVFSTNVQMTREGGNDSVYDVKAYGARGNGVADDSIAIQSAISGAAAAGGFVAYIPPGKYVASSLSVNARVIIQGESGTTLFKNFGGVGTHMFECIGADSASSQTLLSNATLMDSFVTVRTSTTFTPGQYVTIRDDRYVNGLNGRNQQWSRVSSIVTESLNSGTVYLADPLISEYQTVQNAAIVRMGGPVNFAIRDLAIEVASGTAGGGIMCQKTYGAKLENLRISGPNDEPAVALEQSAYGNVEGCRIYDGQARSLGGYGVRVAGGSHHCHVHDNLISNIRENAFDLNARFCSFQDNLVANAYDSGFNSHGANVRWCLVAGNRIVNSGKYGIVIGFGSANSGDAEITVAGNMITNAVQDGIYIEGPSTSSTRNIWVLNNTIYRPSVISSNRYGIYVSQAENIYLEGNVIVGDSPNPRAGMLLSNVSGVRVLNNRFLNLNGGFGISYEAASNNILIEGNSFHSVSQALNTTGTASTNVVVRQNFGDSASVVSAGADVFEGNAWGASYDPLLAGDGIQNRPGLAFRSERSLGWYRSTTNTVALSYGTLSLPRSGAVINGQVGFGLNSPAAYLSIFTDIAGSAALRMFKATQKNSSGSRPCVEIVSAGSAALDIGQWNNNDPSLWILRTFRNTSRDDADVLSEVGSPGLVFGVHTNNQAIFTAGVALAPVIAYSSESSLGWYRSGASTMALSYGTIDLTASGAMTSIASLKIKAGTNNSCGTAVLGSNGSVNVANTYVKTGDLIFLTDQTPGGTLGNLEILGIRNSSGFTIGSTGLTDTSTVAWLIVRPG